MKDSKMKSKYHELMQELVAEVTKESANRARVKELTKKIGIPYAADFVEQMSLILKYCDRTQAKEGQQSL